MPTAAAKAANILIPGAERRVHQPRPDRVVLLGDAHEAADHTRDDRLRDVLDRGWPVGTGLGSEAELIEQHGVSRSVVREAVRILEHHQVAVQPDHVALDVLDAAIEAPSRGVRGRRGGANRCRRNLAESPSTTASTNGVERPISSWRWNRWRESERYE